MKKKASVANTFLLLAIVLIEGAEKIDKPLLFVYLKNSAAITCNGIFIIVSALIDQTCALYAHFLKIFFHDIYFFLCKKHMTF